MFCSWVEFNALRESIQSIWKAFSILHTETKTQRGEYAALLNRVIALENKAQHSEPLDSAKLALQNEVQRIHVGAYYSFAGSRYEVWCPRCGKLLGYGRTERQAWEAAYLVENDMCVAVKPCSCNSAAEYAVKLKHAGAAVLNGGFHQVSNLRCIVCATCGKFLGSGVSEDAAWEMASRANLDCAPKKSPLVDSDFVVYKSGFDGKEGYVEMKQLVETGGALIGIPYRISFYGRPGPLYGHRKLHVTITEVPE